MKFTIEAKNGTTILRLEGKLMGGPDSDGIKSAIDESVAAGKKNILVDLSAVSWVNSTGLGTLIANFATVKRGGGALKLVGVPKRIESILMVTKLNTIFDSFETEEEALRSFSA